MDPSRCSLAARIVILGCCALSMPQATRALEVGPGETTTGAPVHQWITCQAALKLDDTIDAALKQEIFDYVGGSDCEQDPIFGLGSPMPSTWDYPFAPAACSNPPCTSLLEGSWEEDWAARPTNHFWRGKARSSD